MAGCVALIATHAARGAEIIASPAMYPPQTWEGRAGAVVRVLDRLDANLQTLTIPVGQSLKVKSLNIAVQRCLQHPPGLVANDAASLTITDANAKAGFDGWMFTAEPFVGVFQSPVYDVRLVSCAGADAPPAAPPLPVAVIQTPPAQ